MRTLRGNAECILIFLFSSEHFHHRRNNRSSQHLLVGFVALRPKSTAMVIAGRSVHLTTLFPGQA